METLRKGIGGRSKDRGEFSMPRISSFRRSQSYVLQARQRCRSLRMILRRRRDRLHGSTESLVRQFPPLILRQQPSPQLQHTTPINPALFNITISIVNFTRFSFCLLSYSSTPFLVLSSVSSLRVCGGISSLRMITIRWRMTGGIFDFGFSQNWKLHLSLFSSISSARDD